MGVTWLHVSDMHLTQTRSYDHDVVLTALLESVRDVKDNQKWKPDLIFATGDIAGKGDVGVFKGGENAPATKFFNALLEASGVDRKNLFIVPGNHDVERKKGIGLVRTLETQTDIDEYFEDSSPKYHLTFKLEAFASWYNYYFFPRVFPVDSTCELISCEINKVRLELLLINSALFCKEAKSDHGMLCIGRSCIDKCINNLREKRKKSELDLAIALMHHPFEWLHTKYESIDLKNTLRTQVDILLQGHLHQTDVITGNMLQLGAGAGYYSPDSPKRALYGQVNGATVKVRPFCYQATSSPKVWTVDTSLFPHEEGYIGSFTIPSRFKPQETDNNDASRYRDFLKGELENITNRQPNAFQDISVKLSNIFIELRLSESWRNEMRFEADSGFDQQMVGHIRTPAEVMDQAFQRKHLMLVIGDPGSGKTTLLKHYALSCLENDGYKAFGFKNPVMVFYLALRELPKKDGAYLSLPLFIEAIAKEKFHEFPQEIIAGWLENQETLVLLDGLDEISEVVARKEVCQWINKIVTRYPKARFVVTSRTTGYRQLDQSRPKNAIRADIMDFTEEQQAAFLQKWFASVLLADFSGGYSTSWSEQKKKEWSDKQQQKAKDKAEAITIYLKKDKEKTNENKNKSIWALAGVPLLLQFMAMLWKEKDCLPQSRTDLYKNVLEYLLSYQDNRQQTKSQLPAEDAMRVLGSVSLWLQIIVGKDQGSKKTMKKKMQVVLNNLDNPPTVDDFCEDMIYHAGLLIEYGKKDDDMYGFRHKSFREYMAAVKLSKVCTPKQFPKLIKHFGVDWWAEPLRFFIGQCDEVTVTAFINEVIDSAISRELNQTQQDLLVTLVEEAQAIDIKALQVRLNDPDTAKNQQQYLQACLKATGKKEAVDSVMEFAKKGLVNYHTDKLDALYILIKGGTFTYSLTKKPEPVQDLYVAKFTVTNQLYGRFINYLASKEPSFAGIISIENYKTKLLGLAKGIKGFSNHLADMMNELPTRFRSDSADDKRFNKDEQPVMDVTWYAARAYCLWLSLIESGGTNDHLYRLPTEMQWEYAAVGKESRTYPWGEQDPTPTLANYNFNEGATTPVGRYSEGATPEGLYDMAGNVWEWTDSWYDDTCSYRVIRGGGWNDDSERCRSADRGGSGPGDRYDSIGFRLVFVP